MIRVTALLQHSDHNIIILQEVNIPLKMPKLIINVCIYLYNVYDIILTTPSVLTTFSTYQITGKAIVSRKLTAHISFTNPLPVGLQGGVFTVEGAGLTEAREIKTQYVIFLFYKDKNKSGAFKL